MPVPPTQAPVVESVVASLEAPEPPNEQEIEKSLSTIYRDDAGQMPDMTKLEQRRSRWWVAALSAGALFVTVLVAAAWAGFSFFKPYRGFHGQGLSITVEGPERVSLGRDTTFFINYQNISSEPIASADIRVTFPSDFTLAGAEPTPNADGSVWRLGALPVDGRGTIKLHGTFTGALGTVTAVQVVSNFRPASFNSDFDVISTKVLRYEDSVLQGKLIVPVKVLPGDSVSLVYEIENQGDEAVSGLEARIVLPDGFQRVMTSGTEDLDGQQVRLPIGTLAAGASTTVVVKGAFASGVSGEAHLVAQAGRTTPDGRFLPSQRSETSFTVLAGDLSLKLVVNGVDTDTVIPYGGMLRFGIQYENTASEDLKDVVLRMRFESPTSTVSKDAAFVDWNAFEDSASGTRKGNVITWDKKQIPALARLSAHDLGTIDVGLRGVPASMGTSTLGMRAVLEATIASVGDTVVKRVIQAPPILLTYLTDASFQTDVRYFSDEGAPVGTGPLPPVVGQATTYRVGWSVSKKFHELKGIKVTAVLPKIAAWTGNVNVGAGEVTYDDASRTVTWVLNRLPADVGEAYADFDVAITPTEADIGRFAQVVGESRFEATDADLNKPIVQTAAARSTDLQNDDGAKGKGVVRKP